MDRSKSKNSTTVAAMVEKLAGQLEETLMKKLDEKFQTPMAAGPRPELVMFDAQQKVNLPSGQSFSVPTEVAIELQEVIGQRTQNAYNTGLKEGLIAGGILAGFLIFRQIFR